MKYGKLNTSFIAPILSLILVNCSPITPSITKLLHPNSASNTTNVENELAKPSSLEKNLDPTLNVTTSSFVITEDEISDVVKENKLYLLMNKNPKKTIKKLSLDAFYDDSFSDVFDFFKDFGLTYFKSPDQIKSLNKSLSLVNKRIYYILKEKNKNRLDDPVLFESLKTNLTPCDEICKNEVLVSIDDLDSLNISEPASLDWRLSIDPVKSEAEQKQKNNFQDQKEYLLKNLQGILLVYDIEPEKIN